MAVRTIPTVTLPSGEDLPALGLSTRGMAADPRRRDDEIDALRTAVDVGLTLIDTVDGGAEELVREALADRREEVFLVGRIAAEHATAHGTLAACERSLERLGTDRIDLYLLHQRDDTPLAETVEALTMLMTQGLIRHWGVSDFDVPDVVDLTAIPGGTAVEADRIPYDLTRREIEWDLLPRCRAAGLPVMAYSPRDRTGNPGHSALAGVARRHDATPGQVALAWLLRQAGVCAVTRASTPDRVREHRAALGLDLTGEDLAELDAAFPPPRGPRPLQRP